MKVLSLFSGIGAFEKALDRLNIEYELVNYCEIDKYASKSYSVIHNVSEGLNLGDITKVDTSKLPKDIDLVTYGFPCQDISLAGKQKGFEDNGERTRSGLFFEALRIIEDTKPKVAIAENVRNLVSKKFKNEFEIVLNSLEEAGYNNYWQVLNAKDYGIPQNRERVFIVSIRKDIDKGYTFPKPFELKLRLKDMLENKVDEKYFLSGERVNKLLAELVETEQIKEFPCCCDSTINEPKVREISNCITARYNAGIQNQKQIGLCVVVKSKNGIEIPLYKDTKHLRETIEQNNLYEGQPLNLDLYNRSAREHSQTLTDPKHNTQRLWDGLRIRKLTPKECWRLMGFDDEDFEKAAKVISNTQLYKQAGNSIVVNVLEHLLINLYRSTEQESKKPMQMNLYNYIKDAI